jgi:hypothetical protein
MSLNCGAEGAFAAIAVEAAGGTFDASSERYEFLAENIALRDRVVRGMGVTGDLDLIASHLREGAAFVYGQLLMNVTPKELENWLPRILGGLKSGSTHSPGNTLPKFDMLIKRDTATHKYTDCLVASAQFSAETSIGGDDADDEPSLIQLLLTIMGKDETSGTWPASPPPIDELNKMYWIAADSTLTLMSTAYPMDSFRLVINNMLKPKIRNELRPVCIQSQGRIVQFAPVIPASAAAVTALYNTRPSGAASLAFSGAKYLDEEDYATTFTMLNVFGQKVTPATKGRQEIPLQLNMTAYKSGTDASISILNSFPVPE